MGIGAVATGGGRTAKTWMWFAITVAGFFGLGLFTAGDSSPLWLIITGTAVFALATSIVVYVDWVRQQQHVPSDRNPFDLWTIPHTLAGVFFGVFFLPLWVVLIITIVWEVFEATTTGFGDGESFGNHVVDVLVALVGWVAVVAVVSAVTADRFPLLLPQHSILGLW